jgi:dethiobiotin synthetase
VILIAGVSLGFISDTVLTVESIDMIVLALGVLYLGFLIWRHRSRKHRKRKRRK